MIYLRGGWTLRVLAAAARQLVKEDVEHVEDYKSHNRREYRESKAQTKNCTLDLFRHFCALLRDHNV